MARAVTASLGTGALVLGLATGPLLLFHILSGATLRQPWGLGLFALALPVILLYLLKRQRRSQPVSTLLFFAAVRRELDASSPFRQLRRQLLLILQLLLIALFSYALADPVVALGGGVASRVLIIDVSGSMQTRDEGQRSRLERARSEALRVVEGSRNGDELMLIAAGVQARTLQPWTSRKELISRAIRDLRPEDGRARWSDALRLAAGALRGREANAEMLALTDGAGAEVESHLTLPAPLRVSRIGERSANAAITRARLELDDEDPEALLLLLGVERFGAGPAAVELAVTVDGQLRAARQLRLDEPTAPLIRLPRPVGGALVEARIQPVGEGADELAADDVARLIAPPREPWPVVLVSPAPDPALLRALSLDERIALTTLAALPERWPDDARAILIEALAVSEASLAALPAPALLITDGALPVSAWSRGQAIEAQVASGFDREHPLLRYAAPRDVAFAAVRPLVLGGRGRSLMEVEERPVAASVVVEELEHIVLGFALKQTNWPSRLSFPVFLRGFLDFAAGQTAARRARSLRPGDALRLRGEGPSLELRAPGGRVVELPLRDGQGFFAETEAAGVYEVWGEGRLRRKVAVSFCDAAESDVTPGEVVVGGEAAERAAGERPRSLGGAALFLALLLLVAEWGAWTFRL